MSKNREEEIKYMDNFKIILEAMIDNSSLTNVQKQLAKERLKVSADIDFSNFVSEKQKIQQLAIEINKILGDSLKPKEALSWANQYWKQMQSGARQAQREQDKLNQAQKKSSLATQEKYYQRIINNNKTIYSLKEKLLRADEKQSQEIQNQITKLEKRNQYNYSQLSKKGLVDNSWEFEVNTSKEVLENRLRINQEKQKDVALSKQIADVDKIQHSLDIGDYDAQIEVIKKGFMSLSGDAEEAETHVKGLRDTLKSMHDATDDDSRLSAEKKYKLELEKTNNKLIIAKANAKEYVDTFKVNKLRNDIQDWLKKNTAATKEAKLAMGSYLDELEDVAHISQSTFNSVKNGMDNWDTQMRTAGKLGKSLGDTFKEGAKSFAQWTVSSGTVMEVVYLFKDAVTELKEVDTLLTEISKANDKLSTSQLARIGNESFDVASQYGRKSTDYLSGVQEASRAGYENAESIAELSVAIQGAGDVTEDVANSYVIATDKAYKLNGSVKALTEVFDGTNYITNKNAVNMSELAEAMTIVGSTAASFGIEVDETTAAIATMSATTKQSGSEVARAFRAILLNIRQVSDEEEGIDAEGLTKYEKACNALGVSLKETRNGVLQTRDAMDVLKELSEEYVKLDENDLRRTELLNSVGGKVYHVIQKCITRMYLIAGNPLEPCTTI